MPSGPGDLDLTIYGLRKYCRMALKGSPTVLLLLFIDGEHVIERTQRELIGGDPPSPAISKHAPATDTSGSAGRVVHRDEGLYVAASPSVRDREARLAVRDAGDICELRVEAIGGRRRDATPCRAGIHFGQQALATVSGAFVTDRDAPPCARTRNRVERRTAHVGRRRNPLTRHPVPSLSAEFCPVISGSSISTAA
jgi:hypothetical protein